ncbi:DinB family protein [Cnuibacter sp. UC19_7]|uniref:DinB family protein n=1 Tax=Cnuibacter sp. UC19_7 TaxID=3350166 RepID=UPI00366BC17A
MASSRDILLDAFSRIRDTVHSAVRELDEETLATKPDDGGNSIAWLVWHLTRVQDDHIADASGGDQVWLADGWADRFGLPFDDLDTGYGHSGDEVAQVRGVSADQLAGYHDAVAARTAQYLATLDDAASIAWSTRTGIRRSPSPCGS